jgi:general secretion pathway protein L
VQKASRGIAAQLLRLGSWWLAELAELVPERVWRRLREPAGSQVVLTAERTGARVLRCDGETAEELGAVPAGKGEQRPAAALARAIDRAPSPPSAIAIPPGEVLVRTLELPRAALENLRQVLGFEMHRITPFPAADVHFEFRVLAHAPGTSPKSSSGSPPGSSHVPVEVSVVHRSVVEAVLEAAAARDLLPAGILDQGYAALPGWLAIALEERAPKRARTRLRWLVRAANAALAGIIVAVLLLRQESVVTELREQVATARVQAEEADRLRERVAALRAAGSYLVEQKRAAPSTAEVLAVLSASLPDSTWVSRLQVHRREVVLQGQSTEAAALIGRIEDSELFRGAAFSAPVTRNQKTGVESFRLGFEIATPVAGDERT